MALTIGGALMAVGIFGWGNLYEAGLESPVVGSVILGFYTGGMSALNIASGTYTVDAYRELSVELVIIVMVVKNFLFFGVSYFFNDAVAAANLKPRLVRRAPKTITNPAMKVWEQRTCYFQHQVLSNR